LRLHDVAQIDEETVLALVVEAPECPIARMLRVVGVTRALPTYSDRARAVASVAGEMLGAT
ncbi:MAG: hypothetical protein ACTHNU_16805, partial [Gaiellales bacterium]